MLRHDIFSSSLAIDNTDNGGDWTLFEFHEDGRKIVLHRSGASGGSSRAVGCGKSNLYRPARVMYVRPGGETQQRSTRVFVQLDESMQFQAGIPSLAGTPHPTSQSSWTTAGSDPTVCVLVLTIPYHTVPYHTMPYHTILSLHIPGIPIRSPPPHRHSR